MKPQGGWGSLLFLSDGETHWQSNASNKVLTRKQACLLACSPLSVSRYSQGSTQGERENFKHMDGRNKYTGIIEEKWL